MLHLLEVIIQGVQDFWGHLKNIKESVNALTFVFSVILSCFFYPIGGIDALTVGLIVFVIIDYITGIRRSRKKGTISSEKGTRGLEKKAYMYLVIVMANIADKALSISGAVFNWRTAVTAMYLGLEGFSVLENLEDMGFKTPVGLKRFFKYLISREHKRPKDDKSKKE